MLTDLILNTAVTTLSTHNGKSKDDPNIGKYKQGIRVLTQFITQCKEDKKLNQPLAHIAKEMKEGTGSLSAEIEKQSSGKRTWTLIFALAALAIERKQDLPKEHAEVESIDKLLSGLSNGWVNNFGSLGLTGVTFNKEAINNLLEGMTGWINKYDVKQGDQTKHEVLLALYAAASALEEKISSLKLVTVPDEYKKAMRTVKELIADKFKELKTQLELERRQDAQVNGGLQELLPKEEVLYRQFKEQLTHLKAQQAQKQQELDTSEEKFTRIDTLQKLLKSPSVSEEEKIKLFWKEYSTQKQFNQLLVDLDVPEKEKTGWIEYFKYQHGSYREQAVSAFRTGSWGLFRFLGGVPSNTISLEVLTSKSDAAIKPLQAIHAQVEQQKLIPDEEKPSQLVNSIEKDLKNLDGLKKLKMESIEKEYLDVMEHKTTNTLEKINGDIEEFKKNLDKQKEILNSLKTIHEKIGKLKNHLDCTDVEKAFGLFLNEAANTISYMEHPLPSDIPAAAKITAIGRSIDRALVNVQGLQLSLNHMVKECTSQKENVIQLVTEFVSSKEKTWGHTLLSIFSPSYKIMFNELKSALDLNETEQSFNQVKAVLGITDEPSGEKRITSQFKELQEKAMEALGEEHIEDIPTYGKSL
ncbi:hypothetical protein [Legionella sp. 227]|uniref:hypothetical protein n=1 Tax=Legionella sp. 227 TaxID=3367288 RepID=UPI00370D96FA